MRPLVLFASLVLSASALAQSPGGQMGQGGAAPMGGMAGMSGMAGQGFLLPNDPRTAIEVPPHVRDFLRYEMRGHLEQLSTLMARLGEGNFKAAQEFARTGLGVMGNHPPGAPNPAQFVPQEFRMMGMAMHQAANAVAEAAGSVSNPPTAADWKNVMGAVANLTAACSGCHGSFRLK